MVGIKQISWNKKFKWDVFIALSIALLPFLLYGHLLFDNTDKARIEIFGINYQHGFANTSTFIWFFLAKIIPIGLCTIWFLVCFYWWRYFILSPIFINIYSLGKDCFYYPTFVQDNLDLFLFGIILIFGVNLIFWDHFIFKKYRNKYVRTIYDIGLNQKKLFNQINTQLKNLKEGKKSCNDFEYSARLFYLKKYLKDKFKNHYSLPSYGNLGFKSKKEVLFIIGLLLIPTMTYLHLFIPPEQSSFDILWFTIRDNGFRSTRNYIWFLSTKICLLIPLFIWFYTSYNWWRYAILSPIILYTYQLWEANQDVEQLDAFGNLKAFPWIFTVICLLILLSNIFKYHYGILNLHENIESELDHIIDKAAKLEVEKSSDIARFKSLKSHLNNRKQSAKYLSELYALKDKINMQIKLDS